MKLIWDGRVHEPFIVRDVLVGDNSINIAPQFVLSTEAADTFRLFQQGMQRGADELLLSTQDLIYLEHRLRDRTITVPFLFWTVQRVEHHIDALAIGNDVINGGDGNDLIVGDGLTVRAPLLTVVAGGTSVSRDDNHWSNLENWNNRGSRAQWWSVCNWTGHTQRQLDLTFINMDTVNAGSGNDTVWGDTLAQTSRTLVRGAGISNSVYNSASNRADDGLATLAAVVSDTERFFLYTSRWHDHGNYNQRYSWARAEDRAWETARPNMTDGGDVLNGNDGNDILYGQDGRDTINGGLGNDWLVGGNNPWCAADSLTGGGGSDNYVSGDSHSNTLNAAVKAALPTWQAAFATAGLPVQPFSANSQPTSGHPNADVDLLQFIVSPWNAGNTAITTSAASSSATPNANALWVSDFVVRAGQSTAQRNPNGALRLYV